MTSPIRWLAVLCQLGLLGPTRLFAQCSDGSPPPCRQPAPTANTVAVLYFDNLSPDTADAYLADGLTDEIIARLGALDRLLVKSRTAVARYRQTALDPDRLGRALGVAYLVNGTVRRGVGRLRITVELVRASTGNRLWGQQYDRSDADLLAIEGDIATSVVSALVGKLAPAERASLASRPTRSPAAYDHFLKGNYYVDQRRPDASARAIEEYRTAVALDPGFAAPLARMALAYGLILDWGWKSPGVPSASLLDRGLAAADRALRLDSASSDAWLARAFLLRYRHPQTYDGVATAFDRAIALDPRNAEAVHQHGAALTEVGDDSGAVAAYHHALALDADRPITLYQLSQIAMIGHRYTEERRWLDSALVIDPGFLIARARRAINQARLGDAAAALADLETARQLHGEGPELLREQALVYGLLGDSIGLRAAVQRLWRDVADTTNPTVLEAFFTGRALIAAGEPARALDVLERARPRGSYLWWLLRWPEFDPVRADPRFQRLVDEARPR